MNCDTRWEGISWISSNMRNGRDEGRRGEKNREKLAFPLLGSSAAYLQLQLSAVHNISKCITMLGGGKVSSRAEMKINSIFSAHSCVSGRSQRAKECHENWKIHHQHKKRWYIHNMINALAHEFEWDSLTLHLHFYMEFEALIPL